MRTIWVTLLGLSLCVFASQARAGLFTLQDGNSLASFATTTSDAANEEVPVGQYEWYVDGVSHLFQQWFWYGFEDSREYSVASLPVVVEDTFDTNFDQNDDTLFVRYSGGEFRIDISFRLQGGALGSQWSDLAEQIKITNLTDQPLALRFFQYVDLDLNGWTIEETDNDNAQIIGGQIAQQDDIGPGIVANETVVTPKPDHFEVGLWDDDPNIADRLDDEGTTVLADIAGPIFGDATWAFEWDFDLPAGASVQISKDKQLSPVPEPASLILLGLGGLMMARRRRA